MTRDLRRWIRPRHGQVGLLDRGEPVMAGAGLRHRLAADLRPGRPERLCLWLVRVGLRTGRPRLGHEQQIIGSPGSFGSRPLPRSGGGKVFEPVRQDADHVRESGHPALEYVHAFLKGSH